MILPKVITHKNMAPILKAIESEPYFQMGSKVKHDPDAWYWQTVALEVPLGELCEDGLKTMALRGIEGHHHVNLKKVTGKEGFGTQGLEGKARIWKPLFNCLMNLRDLIPPYRGRILVYQ